MDGILGEHAKDLGEDGNGLNCHLMHHYYNTLCLGARAQVFPDSPPKPDGSAAGSGGTPMFAGNNVSFGDAGETPRLIHTESPMVSAPPPHPVAAPDTFGVRASSSFTPDVLIG